MFSRVVANCSAVIGIDPRPAIVRAIESRIKDGMTEWRNAEKNVSNMRVEQKGKHPNHKLSLRSDTGLWRSLKIRFEKKELIDLTADRPFLASSKTLGQEHSDHSFFEQLKGREHKATSKSFRPPKNTVRACVHVPICRCACVAAVEAVWKSRKRMHKIHNRYKTTQGQCNRVDCFGNHVLAHNTTQQRRIPIQVVF